MVAKHLADPDPAKFINQLDDLWFKLYRREAAGDSSGFEHVFVGEIRDGAVIGLHNWLSTRAPRPVYSISTTPTPTHTPLPIPHP